MLYASYMPCVRPRACFNLVTQLLYACEKVSGNVYHTSLIPRLHPQGGKRVWGLGAVCLAWPALGAHTNNAALKQTSDLIGQ